MANSSVENFDAIIVLGAAQMPDGSSSPAIERRVARAAELWRDNVGERLILSGGKTISDIPEAETMADLARSMGVPNDVIELET
ncbi:MAG: hypothetical protein CBB68_12770 [Rhodospirillaceae bacterium TMED8]|nr:hypothetical protein [Magnetovibrio sp.]OUT48979.1 MAG: hypothetical protein CBB68_12770 [Rhodospirillaceae bacterium TMED8]